MSTERKPRVSPNPEYPYTKADIREAAGLLSDSADTGLKNLINKITRDPFTDEKSGRVWLSEADYNLVLKAIEEKRKKSANPEDEAVTHSKPRHTRQLGEIPIRALKTKIKLPNGDIIQKKQGGRIVNIINEVLLAQQNKTPYTQQQIINNRGKESLFRDVNWIRYVVDQANNTLRPHHYELTSREIEIGNEKIRTYEVTEIKTEKSTSSPEPQSPKV